VTWIVVLLPDLIFTVADRLMSTVVLPSGSWCVPKPTIVQVFPTAGRLPLASKRMGAMSSIGVCSCRISRSSVGCLMRAMTLYVLKLAGEDPVRKAMPSLSQCLAVSTYEGEMSVPVQWPFGCWTAPTAG
jgi:hypothetical protein